MTVEIPADFPREFLPGSVPGVQQKLLVREIGGKYLSGMTGAERTERYEIGADLNSSLSRTANAKKNEMPEWSFEDILCKTNQGLRSKNWDLSEAEITWTIVQVAQGLLGTESKQ